jgi:hypothetical protein
MSEDLLEIFQMATAKELPFAQRQIANPISPVELSPTPDIEDARKRDNEQFNVCHFDKFIDS